MDVILLKGLIALVPTCLLLCGSAVLFLDERLCALSYSYSAHRLWLWSFLLTYSKPLTCFLGCIGGPRMALVIISISGVLFSASRCFP